jgi:hypothetical protein
MSIPTNFLTATETQALLAEGKVTPTQVVKDHQARYQARDSAVHAWVCTNFDGALALAAGGGTKGLPLHGVVIAVKDIISTYFHLHSFLDWTDIRYQGYAHGTWFSDLQRFTTRCGRFYRWSLEGSRCDYHW